MRIHNLYADDNGETHFRSNRSRYPESVFRRYRLRRDCEMRIAFLL